MLKTLRNSIGLAGGCELSHHPPEVYTPHNIYIYNNRNKGESANTHAIANGGCELPVAIAHTREEGCELLLAMIE
jgi:hypothetical protein